MKVLQQKTATGRCLSCGAQLEIAAGDVKYPISWLDDRAYIVCGACNRKLVLSDEQLFEHFGLKINRD